MLVYQRVNPNIHHHYVCFKRAKTRKRPGEAETSEDLGRNFAGGRMISPRRHWNDMVYVWSITHKWPYDNSNCWLGELLIILITIRPGIVWHHRRMLHIYDDAAGTNPWYWHWLSWVDYASIFEFDFVLIHGRLCCGITKSKDDDRIFSDDSGLICNHFGKISDAVV